MAAALPRANHAPAAPPTDPREAIRRVPATMLHPRAEYTAWERQQYGIQAGVAATLPAAEAEPRSTGLSRSTGTPNTHKLRAGPLYSYNNI